ncbi:hypothetical protein [Shewanella scandinavica]|uniref:SMI1/KNR4 family protein n=1 Tax=Shewanella scandinavica TaxID=3063538 RepID=A0ABU3G276_9GAMM|nr:hypothetical protein [Shewanella sp. SP2S1-2]MDT3281737.1 hypothetical protein [Shewanella sp. SP2S1-2]
MKLLDWIKANRPGNLSEYDDRFEIEHQSGECSTLFKNSGTHVSTMSHHKSLGDMYTSFDGVDLFSSTFKIASIESPKSVGDVELVESLSKFQNWVKQLNPSFPERVVPFMYQAGIGIYAVGEESGKIYEWDDEQGTLSDEFDSLEQILTEWLDAIV